MAAAGVGERLLGVGGPSDVISFVSTQSRLGDTAAVADEAGSPAPPRLRAVDVETQPDEPRFLGAGRGAQVFALRAANGATIAKKVFVGSGLARFVHQFIFGADNPYVWDRTAIEEARQRRRVLSPLVRWWLKGKLHITEIYDTTWNDTLKVNEWTMEYVDGRFARLRQPFAKEANDEIDDLVNDVMRPLQRHLVEAGFDGAAWQAGLHNPVATSNFLRRFRRDGSAEWVWIDVESGVPALFPANPIGLFSYYIPRAIKFGRPLFDDVDCVKLRQYLALHEPEMRPEIGDDAWHALMCDVDALEAASAQSGWKKLGRTKRGIGARLTRGEINADQAEFYKRYPLLWMMREFGGAVSTVLRALAALLSAWFDPKLWLLICRETVKLLWSDSYRTAFAKRYVTSGIDRWRDRKQLTPAERDSLVSDLGNEGSAAYLTDFGMHLATKPLVKLVTWGGVPVLYAFGLMSALTLAILVIGGGAIVRTGYTLIRVVDAYRNGYQRPWVALWVGTLPVIGNVAFPLQLLFDGVGNGRNLSQFIVYDTATRVGRSLPIWGGADTLTEHRANRAADWLFSLSKRLNLRVTQRRENLSSITTPRRAK